MSETTQKKKIHIRKTFFRLLPLCYSAAPGYFISTVILSIAHGASWGLLAPFQQRLFDAATGFVSHTGGTTSVFYALLALFAVTAVCQILNGVGNFLPWEHGNIACGRIGKKIAEKIQRVSPEVFENTDLLDAISKAEEGKNNAFWFVFSLLNIAWFYLPYFLVMAWYLFSLKPIFALFIALAFIPTALSQVLRTKVFAGLAEKSAPVRREYEYYEKCMVDREYYKETRQLGGFGYFKRLYMDSLRIMNKMNFSANIKTNLAQLGTNVMTIVMYAIILFMLFKSLMAREISVGAFAAVFASLGMIFGIMWEVVCMHMGRVAQQLGTVQNYVDFLDLPEREGENMTLPEHCNIALDNVTFAYPKAERDAIAGVTLNIKDGETIAVVGENGSGKSTLIRLITGLYLPKNGSVKYGDIDTRKASMASLFDGMSAVFQRYQRYQMTLSENITISRAGGDVASELLTNVSDMAGVERPEEQFTDGFDTMLSREFDGIDLSGGQWQRVAIARGLYRAHRLIVLDEPTAAIDPIEETRIYNRFAEISRDKTAIIVTHRLGSVRLADRIVVMKDGVIAEIGHHDELMEMEGEYARMYNSQLKWYTKGRK